VKRQYRTTLLILMGLILAACAPLGQREQFASSFLSSSHLDPIPVEQEVAIITSHQTPKGIQKVDFKVSGVLVNTQRPPFPDVQFIVTNKWTPPAAGNYAVEIVAYDSDNNFSTLNFTITATDRLIPVATKITATETRPAPTLPPAGTVVACLNSALMVSETVSPGAEFPAGSQIEQTWRIRNNGTCNWDTNYYMDNINNQTLGGSRVNLTGQVQAGSEFNLTLRLVAPSSGGTYRSEWRMHDSAGRPFPQTFVVEIVAPSTCELPRIDSFQANPGQITQGQSSTLSWQVAGAQTLRLSPGSQLSGATGSTVVAPNQTTTYSLIAAAGDCQVTRQVTVTVQPGISLPAAPTNLQITQIGQTSMTLTWQDNSDNEVEFRLYDVDTGQHLFTYAAGATQGQATGLQCGRTYRWQLRAANNQGLSIPSNVATAATSACS
jgi:hypothetical protein